jgi:uncharacterized protein
MKIGLKEGKELITLARDTIKNSLEDKKIKEDEGLKKKYHEKMGCFVTLTIGGKLRGCIGYPEPILPLYDAIIDSANNAAFSDPRFPSLSNKEFEKIEIEISVLTVPELIKGEASSYPSQIKIGRDGLIIRGPYGSGLLLPQVFTEYDCNSEKALLMTCQKAMLEPDAWKDKKNKVYKFSAIIFSEEDGKIIQKKI